MNPTTIEQALQIAFGHHQAGRLAEAEGIYRQVLAQIPDHADTLHLLGVLAHQTGHSAAAMELIGRAIALNPAIADYHSNLGETYRSSGQLEAALACFRRAVELKPDLAEAHNSLGLLLKDLGRSDEAIDAYNRAIALRPGLAEAHNNLGNARWAEGRLDEAIDAYQRAIALRPGLPEAHLNLGIALKDAGRLDEAIDACNRAIALRPDHAETYINLGNALYARGRLDEALDACKRVVELRPDHAAAYLNLGNTLCAQGRFDEAIPAYNRAIALRPELAEAHNNLGNALRGLGRLDEAIAACNRAIELRPDLAEAHINLGNALMSLRKPDEAIAALRRAIALQPDLAEAHINLSNALLSARRLDEAIDASMRAIALRPDLAEAHNNLATVWQETGRTDEAIAAYRTAIALKPDYAVAYNNLGSVLKEQGRLDDALASFRRALELNPDGSQAASNLVYTLHFHPDYDAQAILEEHRRQVRQLVEPLAVNIRPHPNDRTPDRRLRVGFLSPDFRGHPVGQSLVPLFAHHDRRQTEIVAYSDVRVADRVTAQLKALADQWHDTLPLSNDRLADRIRADRIDILVDPTLHTAYNRLLVFARKPAPIQLTMLGPPTTTGLEAIDYRLTDRFLDPPGESDGDYTEHSIRLPHCFWCYQPPEEAPPVGDLPARKKGVVTFGCLNQFAKVSRPALQLWINILQSLPASRLVIQSQPGSHLEAVRRLFEDGGIALDRVEFAARVPPLQYLHRYHELDLCLDPFPFGGHTSTLDSLWMGVPVITLAGRTAVGRGGVSLLSNVGLPELIAHAPQQYVALAVQWATDLPRLAALRAGLRQRVQASRLVDGEQFAADVEATYRRVWRTWCGR